MLRFVFPALMIAAGVGAVLDTVWGRGTFVGGGVYADSDVGLLVGGVMVVGGIAYLAVEFRKR